MIIRQGVLFAAIERDRVSDRDSRGAPGNYV